MKIIQVLKLFGLIFSNLLLGLQVLIFFTFELAAPAYVEETSSHWYGSFFLITIPISIVIIYMQLNYFRQNNI